MERTQSEMDQEIPHDNQTDSASAESQTDPTAPLETTESATQTPGPLIGDHNTTGTTIKPIC